MKSSESAYPLVAAAVRAESASCARTSSIAAPVSTGEVEQTAGGGAHGLGRIGVRAGAGQQHQVGAGGVRGTDQGADVAGIADLVEHDDGDGVLGNRQRGSAAPAAVGSSAGRAPTATTPCGETRLPEPSGVSGLFVVPSPAVPVAAVSRTRARRICSSTIRSGTPAPRARSASSGWSPAAHSVRKTSRASPGRWRSSERTDCGPSNAEPPLLATRRAPGQCRHLPHPLRAGRGDRRLVRALCSSQIVPRCQAAGALTSLGRAFFATSTRAANAGGLVHGELGEHATVDLDACQA